jgi:TRAP-type C4-dicarboxylate transport system permease small subunit
MSSLDAPPPSRTEKVIAAFIASTMGVSVMAFFAIIIGTWRGMTSAEYAQGLWPIITWVPNSALPAGFVLIIVLLITSTRRRRSTGGHASSE